MGKAKLPRPDSPQLKALVPGGQARAIYKVLYENRSTAVSMADIRRLLNIPAGEQEHLNRRLRDLYGFFKIENSKRGKETVYQLISLSDDPHQTSGKISKTLRAWVLRDQKCVQCGRTPSEDKVKLHVDHIVPQKWGGTDEQENLQALCSECNEGKKNFYSSFNKFGGKIKKAISYNEPHKRLGELLKAFGGEPVPAELLEMVAKAKQYQEDWQKRMRELRVLGWKFSAKRLKEGGRSKAYYSLEHFEPWPAGNIRAEIRRRELKKK